MSFGLSTDRMVMWWTTGDSDLAHGLATIEGFEIATGSAGGAVAYRVANGTWEKRIGYVSKKRTAERARQAQAREDRRA